MHMRRVAIILLSTMAVFPASQAVAQGLAGMEPKILDLTRGSWAYFRDYNGRQLVYFTHLEAYRCGITKVSYSLDSDALDQEWVLQPCDPKKPNVITTDRPYISLPLGTAQSVAVQLTFNSGKKSAIVRINTDNQLIK